METINGNRGLSNDNLYRNRIRTDRIGSGNIIDVNTNDYLLKNNINHVFQNQNTNRTRLVRTADGFRSHSFTNGSGYQTAGIQIENTPEDINRIRELTRKMKRFDKLQLSVHWSRQCPEPKRSLRPILKDQFHQDSVFGNSFQSRSFFVVHPEWLSEAVDNREPEPMHRPPWPWEQPRYRQNVQIPITYSPKDDDKKEEEDAPTDQELGTQSVLDIPEAVAFAVPLGLPLGYTFTQPGIDLTRPYEKHTRFGAPLVDTSSYKLSY